MGKVTVIGGGLAGVEAAFKLSTLGAEVSIIEMKPKRFSPVHSLDTLAELVCSNSLKSEAMDDASGLLKEEMRRLGSIVMEEALRSRVPAGRALAVDRGLFSAFVTKRLLSLGVEIIRKEAVRVPDTRPLVIATGPLTSDAFSSALSNLTGGGLYFYDAIAPIIYKDSIDFDAAFMASRYGKGGADYINCPMDKEEYERFVEELLDAEVTPRKAFEEMRFFEGCMPVEAMAARGKDTLAFGPMRPVGITDPRTGSRPWAVLQLRQENAEGTIYNAVGFQTRLTQPAQRRVLGLIPGLKGARFARYGSMHRNTYVDSPRLVDASLELRSHPGVFLAGQITGVEGYMESAASGIVAGINAWRALRGMKPLAPPPSTMTGALLGHISNPGIKNFQPMNVNFGLLGGGGGGRKNRGNLADMALAGIDRWKAAALDKNYS